MTVSSTVIRSSRPRAAPPPVAPPPIAGAPAADTGTGEEYGPQRGLSIGPISDDDFRAFARRHASSDEVGPIRTCLDRDAAEGTDAAKVVNGLWACHELCAVICVQLYRSRKEASTYVAKLDSVIANDKLRRRGLAGLLVARTFLDLVTDADRNVIRLYAHSVHPGTVRLLRRLEFSDPPPVGAPISDLSLEGERRDAFIGACGAEIRGHMSRLGLQCTFCRNGDRRARPWCVP